MPNPRILKRNKLVRKKTLFTVGKGLLAGTLAAAIGFGTLNVIQKRNLARIERKHQIEMQEIAYKSALRERQIAKEDRESEAKSKEIKDAIKRGMIPRLYTKKDGSVVIADYIDPPSGGKKRSKPVETRQAELIRKELREK